MSSPVFIFTGQAQELDLQLQNTIAELTKATAAVGLKPTPIGTAIDECCESKLRSGLSKAYVTGLRQYLTAWSRGQESRHLHTVTTEELEKWFTSRAEIAATRAANRGRLSALFNYAIRRTWARDNPTLALDCYRIFVKTPPILGPRRAMRLLLFCLQRYPQHLAYAVLTLKVGLRPFELVGPHGVSWDRIDFIGRTVVIDALATKVRTRRVVQLGDDEMEWLKLAQRAGSVLPLSHMTYNRAVIRFRHALGFKKWPQDLLRHTCASVLLALTGDLTFTSRNLGNSPNMVLRHYASMMNKPTAERYLFRPKPRHWKLAEELGEFAKAGIKSDVADTAVATLKARAIKEARREPKPNVVAAAVIPFPEGRVKTGRYVRDRDGQWTLRERQVLSLISEGIPDTQMAVKLGVSPGTIGKHVQKLMHRLGCHTRGEALKKYVEKIATTAQSTQQSIEGKEIA